MRSDVGKRLEAVEVFGQALELAERYAGSEGGLCLRGRNQGGIQGPGGVAVEGKMVDGALVFAAGG